MCMGGAEAPAARASNASRGRARSAAARRRTRRRGPPPHTPGTAPAPPRSETKNGACGETWHRSVEVEMPFGSGLKPRPMQSSRGWQWRATPWHRRDGPSDSDRMRRHRRAQGVAVRDDRLAVAAVPAVELDAAAALQRRQRERRSDALGGDVEGATGREGRGRTHTWTDRRRGQVEGVGARPHGEGWGGAGAPAAAAARTCRRSTSPRAGRGR